MKRTADRLFGKDYQWSVLGAGRNQLPIAAMSVAMGGNIRVGLEDSLWIGPGKLARSNAEQVRAAREIIERLGLEVATPDDARRDPVRSRAPTRSISDRRAVSAPGCGQRHRLVPPVDQLLDLAQADRLHQVVVEAGGARCLRSSAWP